MIAFCHSADLSVFLVPVERHVGWFKQGGGSSLYTGKKDKGRVAEQDDVATATGFPETALFIVWWRHKGLRHVDMSHIHTMCYFNRKMAIS